MENEIPVQGCPDKSGLYISFICHRAFPVCVNFTWTTLYICISNNATTKSDSYKIIERQDLCINLQKTSFSGSFN